MAKSSTFTKKCRRLLWFYRVIDFLLLFLPVIIYVIIALADGGVTSGAKVAVVGSVTIALILSAFNVISQKRLRCPIWIILIGLMVAIQRYLLPLIIMLAVTSILDDLILTPLIQYYKTKLIANKAMDERLPDKE